MGDEADRANEESNNFIQDYYEMDILSGNDYRYGIDKNGLAYRLTPYILQFKNSKDAAYLYRDKNMYPTEIIAICNSESAYYKLRGMLRLFQFSSNSRVETNENRRKITIELGFEEELKNFIRFIRNNNYVKNGCSIKTVKRSTGLLDVSIKFKRIPLPKYKKRLRDFQFKYDSAKVVWNRYGISQDDFDKVKNYLKKQNLI